MIIDPMVIDPRDADVFANSHNKHSVFCVGEQIEAVLRFLEHRVRGYDDYRGVVSLTSQSQTFTIRAIPIADADRRFEYSLDGITPIVDPVATHVKLVQNHDTQCIGDDNVILVSVVGFRKQPPVRYFKCIVVCADTHREIIFSTPN